MFLVLIYFSISDILAEFILVHFACDYHNVSSLTLTNNSPSSFFFRHIPGVCVWENVMSLRNSPSSWCIWMSDPQLWILIVIHSVSKSLLSVSILQTIKYFYTTGAFLSCLCVQVCFWACVRKWIQCKWSILCLILYFCSSVTFSPATLSLQVKQCTNPVDLCHAVPLGFTLIVIYPSLQAWLNFFFFYQTKQSSCHLSRILCEVKTVKF